MSRSSSTSLTIALTGTSGISSPMRMLPEGLIVLPAVRAVDDLVGREAVGPQPVGVDADDDGPLAAAERRRGRDAGQAGEHRPDLEQRLVLDLADRLASRWTARGSRPGTLPVSKRMMNGGTVPGGMKARERLT